MKLQAEIINTINERGGVPPFTVWTTDFVDLENGQEVPNSGCRPQRDVAQTDINAVLMYLDIYKTGAGVHVKVPAKIVDSRDIQVYP